MEAGVHLPQLDLDGEGLSRRRLLDTVAGADACGFAAVSANDHFVFARPWLDGLTALAVASQLSGQMDLVTSVALPVLRGPLPLAAAAAALGTLSGGRVILGIGAGSSRADYAAAGVPFEERWSRLDDAATVLRAVLRDEPASGPSRFYPVPAGTRPAGTDHAGDVPIWIGSWGSPAGLRRVRRLGDGWLASAYNTDPERFGQALTGLSAPAGTVFPHAVVTMWTWVTDRAAEADHKLTQVVAPLVGRAPAALAGRLCVGSAQQCAELLIRYAQAGCQRVHFWPLGDERRQIERIAGQVLPLVSSA